MAQNPARDKSPMSKRPHAALMRKKSGGVEVKSVTAASCGCSLKSFHGNLSSIARPSKYKLSQIWPLFRHEFAMPGGAVKKLDRGGSSCSLSNGSAGAPSSRRGFIRSSSPQHPSRIKSPFFAGVSMQRDNYVEVSSRSKPAEDYGDDSLQSGGDRHNHDSIPMGKIVCTARGSPCCTENLHCANPSGDGDLDVEVDNATSSDQLTPEKIVRTPGLNALPKRLRSTSPRSDDLYTAVEREFKRLGIYKDCNAARAPTYRQNEEVHLSPSNNKAMEAELQMEYRDMHPCDDEFEWPSQATTQDDDVALESEDQQSFVDQHYGHHLSAYANQQCENRTHESRREHMDARISPSNAIESFISLSNALCVTHFSVVIKQAETSMQRFTNYLIKARQRMMMRANPSQAPLHKHDITASMIRPMMPSVEFDSRHHFKYGLQACISKVIFDQFDTQKYGTGEPERTSGDINRQFMFLRAYYVLEALDTCNGEQLMEINGEFQQFCHRKLEAMKRRVGWESRWPSKLLQAFLCCLKDVWVAHKLAFAFENPVSIFFAKPRSPLDLEHMNPLMESANSKQSPNPKYMSPMMETSFTKLNSRPPPDPKLHQNKASHMGGFDTSINHSPRVSINLSPLQV